ncbi:molybdopterin molybdotransferase [Aeromicrobium panaciterrae]|uniref:Molybdopterin molybdenumtransferase n=1 Tax=Aeromicrobium panaciterrae TaxID=363861 RepID=A0ABU1UQW0_9ACTN|nr:gephyrin-like molybdotransferase Glp [Aeromicrobium panaciterrae]MDR7087567.1 molybdopterin molybdotransferase [Aeromicrobium panaciterrae]
MPSEVIEVEDHLANILRSVTPLPTETIQLRQAGGRTLARDLIAAHDIPSFENSSMDGFAVLYADVSNASPENPVSLEIVADIPAGTDLDPLVASGQAARLMTGSVMPSSADTIVPFEHTVEGLTDRLDRVTVIEAPRTQGVFVRRPAEDIAVGDLLLHAGTHLGPRQLASALAAGLVEAQVARTPRIAIVSTGSELVTDGSPLARGQIPDSNSPMLAELAREAGAEVVLHSSVSDHDAEVLAVVQELEKLKADLVVFTGGISAGAYDVVKSALSAEDLMQFTQVRMQPGKPQGFGVAPSGLVLFGLPGNPVSTAVSWEVFVRPALLAMQGRTEIHRRVIRVRTTTGWKSPSGRRQYTPVALDTSDAGQWTAGPASSGHSGSHLVGSLALADGYAVIAAETEVVEAGQEVDVMVVA